MSKFFLDKAPLETYRVLGKIINVRRDDLAVLPPLPPNTKMTALYNIVKHAYSLGYEEVVMFAKKQQGTPYAIGLPPICQSFLMNCIITYPLSDKQKPPHWIFEMLRNNFNVVPYYLRPNMITVNVNQSKNIAEKRGAYFIPFGFDHEISVETHANKFELPQNVGTLVLSTMTGMILAGTLKQIYTRGYNVKRVYGISSGRSEASIYKSMRPYLDLERLGHLHIEEAFGRETVIDQSDKSLFPFPMHPDYEAKAWAWMISKIQIQNEMNAIAKFPEPIFFINSGR